MKDGSQNTRLDFNNYNKPIRENDRDRGRNDWRDNKKRDDS